MKTISHQIIRSSLTIALLAASAAASAQQWLPAEQVDRITDPERRAVSPHVVVNPQGNAFVAWREYRTDASVDKFPSELKVNRRTQAGWGTPEILEANTLDRLTERHAEFPRMAVDGSGNIQIVWQHTEYDNSHTFVMSEIRERRFLSTNGQWQTPSTVSAVGRRATEGRVAMDSAGNTLAAFIEGRPERLFARALTAGQSFQGAQQLDNLITAPSNVVLALGNAGNGAAVWVQFTGSTRRVRAASYRSSSWSQPDNLGAPLVGGAGDPHLALNQFANGIAVWPQGNGILTRQHRGGTGFIGSATPINDTEAGVTRSAHVSINAAGSAIAVYQQQDDSTGQWNLYANRYDPFTDSWGTPMRTPIDDEAGEVVDSKVIVDSAGNAVAVFVQKAGSRRDLLASHFTLAAGWSDPERLESGDGNVNELELAVAANGTVMAVWSQLIDTTDHIISRRFQR